MSNFKKNWETMGFTLGFILIALILINAPQLALFLGGAWIFMKLGNII